MITIPTDASVAVLTGAGISVASGISPFRGPGGIWSEIDADEVVSAQAWRNRPDRVREFLNSMRQAARSASPSEAHTALAKAEAARTCGARFVIITQNIDNLHRRAGSNSVCELHGSLEVDRCDRCSHRFPQGSGFCECGTPLRPHVVLFNEAIPADALQDAQTALQECDFFVAIGTSGAVWPASNFVVSARNAGARCVNVNLESSGTNAFHEELLGPADRIVPPLFGV